MNLPWINVNAKLLEGVALINSTDTKEFSSLLQRLAQLKTNEIITPEELQRFEKSFGLETEKISFIIKTTHYILQRILQVILKPVVLQEHLTGPLRLSEEKAKEFLSIWIEDTKKNFGNLESKNDLEKISWELSLQTASNINLTETIPTAKVQLTLKNATENKTDEVFLDLDENDLLKLFNSLEILQNKLDSLRSLGQ